MYMCVFVWDRVRSISDAVKLRVQGWTVRLLQWWLEASVPKAKENNILLSQRAAEASRQVSKFISTTVWKHIHTQGRDKQPAKAGLIDVSGYLFITVRRTDSREFVSPFQTRLSLPWLSTFRFSPGVLLPGDMVTEEFHRTLTWRKSRRKKEEKCFNSMSYH